MVTWSTITEEVYESTDFRQRLVTVFRKYEGQETDQRDKSNRVVKVTRASFARHFGVPEGSFDRWVTGKDYKEVNTTVVPTSDEVPAQEPEQRPSTNEVRPPPQREPEVVENPVRTPAEYKADRALVEEQLQPLRDAINAVPESFALPCFIGTLEEANDMLAHANPAYVTKEDIQAAYDQVAQLTQGLMQLELALTEVN